MTFEQILAEYFFCPLIETSPPELLSHGSKPFHINAVIKVDRERGMSRLVFVILPNLTNRKCPFGKGSSRSLGMEFAGVGYKKNSRLSKASLSG